LAPHPPAGTFSPPEGRRVRVRGLCSPAEGLAGTVLSQRYHHPHPVIPVLVTGIQQRHVHGAQDSSLTAPTRRSWIPVTSTGMTVEKAGHPYQPFAIRRL